MADEKRKRESEDGGGGSANQGGVEKALSPVPMHQHKKSKTGMDYVALTTHPNSTGVNPIKINWGADTPMKRGPIILSDHGSGVRNAIGAHGGSYCVYRALALAQGKVTKNFTPDLTDTSPAWHVPQNPSWSGDKIVTFDPFGHTPQESFPKYFAKGYDIRPTIAVTNAHIDLVEVQNEIKEGRLKPDGHFLKANGSTLVHKAAVEPAWHLPSLAKRLGATNAELRKHLFQETNGMYPELLTRTDIEMFLPPIGGLTIYVFGDPAKLQDEATKTTVRVHDECNGSDVFGSDICTCRPYLIHGIIESIKQAQEGGVGVIVYFRKEGRALGEVTKYLVYNRRKRQKGGDKASEYFNCTSRVAGVEDTRFQSMMPDALHWLGIKRIDRFISMSDMKYNAVTASGIKVVERVPIPPEMVPDDAQVEIAAKVFAGYAGGDVYKVSKEMLDSTEGRGQSDFFATKAEK